MSNDTAAIANEIELRQAISRIGNLETLTERRAAAARFAPAFDAFLAHFADEPEYCAAWREELDASVEDFADGWQDELRARLAAL